MGAAERYQKLGLRESFSRIYDYPSACIELGFLLRGAYSKLPKNLQAIMLQDTLAAFCVLPEVPTSRAVSAANLLLQAAEVALPKQKRALAVTEFKHAIVAHKRHCKARQDEGSAQLPQDVLAHIFSFLDMRSLVTVGLVSWSWNSAANDNMLWKSQYDLFFGVAGMSGGTNEQTGKAAKNQKDAVSYRIEDYMDPVTNLDWRESFRRKYIGNSSWKSTSNRGYCRHCKSIIWLSNMICSNEHHYSKAGHHLWKIKPISAHQVVAYVLGDSPSAISSSDSDSDSDGTPSTEQWRPKLWSYPRHMRSGNGPLT